MSESAVSAAGAVRPVEAIRAQFPALRREHRGQPVAYFDGPGGTQVPRGGRRAHARLPAQSQREHALGLPDQRRNRRGARGRPAGTRRLPRLIADEVAFGANMTTLTFHVSPGPRARVAAGRRGDRHRTRSSCQRRSVARRRARSGIDRPHGRADRHRDRRARLARPRTRVHASDAAARRSARPPTRSARSPTSAAAARLAHDAGALCFVDAVHYAPHAFVDVRAIGCDLLACSPYKFYGPHVGTMYVRAGSPRAARRAQGRTRRRQCAGSPRDRHAIARGDRRRGRRRRFPGLALARHNCPSRRAPEHDGRAARAQPATSDAALERLARAARRVGLWTTAVTAAHLDRVVRRSRVWPRQRSPATARPAGCSYPMAISTP